jgi:hypothetical protein
MSPELWAAGLTVIICLLILTVSAALKRRKEDRRHG